MFRRFALIAATAAFAGVASGFGPSLGELSYSISRDMFQFKNE